MKKILAAIILATFTVAAYAQTGTVNSKANLATEINTDLPNNTTGAITPAILRQVLQDIMVSLQQYGTVPTGAGTASQQTVTLIATPQAGQIFSFIPGVTNSAIPSATYLSANNSTNLNIVANTCLQYYCNTFNIGANTLVAGQTAVLLYDGSQYVLLNPQVQPSNQFYVATPSGIDQGTCQSSAAPCRTALYVGNIVQQTYMNGQTAYINFGSGTWNGDWFYFKGCPLGWQNNNDTLPCIIINGNGSTNTTIECTAACHGGTIVANGFADVGVQNVTISSTAGDGTDFASVYANLGGHIELYGNVIFAGSGHFADMYIEETGSAVYNWDNYERTGGTTPYHIYANLGGQFFNGFSSAVATMVATPTFSTTFILGSQLANIYTGGITWTGTAVTATKYILDENSILETNGNCASVPGTRAGSATRGALCD